MSPQRNRWMRRLAIGAVGLLSVVVLAGLALKNYATPMQRSDIQRPLYTVGDANYAVALEEGKNIVKFGRLPWGIYPGGLAFDNANDAWEHLRAIGKEQTWGVYQLSGDFELDTKLVKNQRYTTVSLLVLGENDASEVAVQPKPIDYQTFDQTPNSGWRVPAAEGKYAEAARMIDEYVEVNSKLPDHQTRVLAFHAGQMHAYAGNNETARERFQNSLAANEPEDSPIRWNAYVRATIAFLDQDRQELMRCRDEIASGPKMGDMVPNLDVVDSLLAEFGQPYSTAYEAHRGSMQQRR